MSASIGMLDQIREVSKAKVDVICDLAVRICQVPSPTGMEEERAHFVGALLEGRGYSPEYDDVGNVYTRRGQRGGPVILVDAHLDTVFSASTEIEAFRDGDVLRGPGIGDNCLSIAASLALLDILDELDVETELDVVVAATVGEEGLGNLRGARAAVERYHKRSELAGHLVLDGKIGLVTHIAVGSNRWNVTVRGPGGHSFAAFGLPSAIHGLGRIIAAIADLDVPEDPKTTFNVGLIEGGTSVNTIAPTASAVIDMRSTDAGALEKLSARVEEIIATLPGKGLESTIEVVGERPAGMRPLDDPLVQLAFETLEWFGYEPEGHSASTNMNIPISLGIPTVCIGISDGQGTHTVNEYIPIAPIADGMAQLVRLTIDGAKILASVRT